MKNSKGGFQSSISNPVWCKCGKETGRKKIMGDKEISIHFGKSAYWHIYDFKTKELKRTFIRPKEWIF